MKRFFRRLTWGFLPEGWRRIVLIVLHVFGTYYSNELFPSVVKTTVTPLLGNGKPNIDDSHIKYEYIRGAIGVDDLAMAAISIMILSLIVSWIVDGFRNTERK